MFHGAPGYVAVFRLQGEQLDAGAELLGGGDVGRAQLAVYAGEDLPVWEGC